MRNKKIIAVVGSGFVNEKIFKQFSNNGHEVICVNSDEKVLEHFDGLGIKTAKSPEKLAEESKIDAFFLIIPTPIIGDKIDLGVLNSTIDELASEYLARSVNRPIVVITNTILPIGAIEETLIPNLNAFSGKTTGIDFGVCFISQLMGEEVPESLRAPRTIIVGESDGESGLILENILNCNGTTVKCVSLEIAVMQWNIQILIALAASNILNEIKGLCEKSKIKFNEIFPLINDSAKTFLEKAEKVKDIGKAQLKFVKIKNLLLFAKALKVSMPVSETIAMIIRREGGEIAAEKAAVSV